MCVDLAVTGKRRKKRIKTPPIFITSVSSPRNELLGPLPSGLQSPRTAIKRGYYGESPYKHAFCILTAVAGVDYSSTVPCTAVLFINAVPGISFYIAIECCVFVFCLFLFSNLCPTPSLDFHSVPYCTVLYCIVLYCTILYCTVLHHTVFYCTMLYCTVLYCTALYCTVPYCTVPCCTVPYCTVLHHTVLYHTVLYCCVYGRYNSALLASLNILIF